MDPAAASRPYYLQMAAEAVVEHHPAAVAAEHDPAEVVENRLRMEVEEEIQAW